MPRQRRHLQGQNPEEEKALIPSNWRFRRSKRDGNVLKERDDLKKDCNVDKFERLNIGCSATDTMEFHSSCGVDSNSGKSFSLQKLGSYFAHYL